MDNNFLILIPEISLLVLTCIALVLVTVKQESFPDLVYWVCQFSLLFTVYLLVTQVPDDTVIAFSGSFISDPLSIYLKITICIFTFFIFFYSREYLKEHGLSRGEYFVLGLFAVLGMMVMTAAYSLLTVYLGLELLSLSLYSMVAMHRDSILASEAAMKYFVLGAMASGLLLYGISIIYGLTGTLQLEQVADSIVNQQQNRLFLVYGMVFIIIGIAFKLGAVPFHMWIPDVYQGAPTSVTLFISSAPKLAAFAMAIRLLVNGLEPLLPDWQSILIILAILSMATGNIIAISQSNIKRMLAYSTIAHVGFLLLGLIAGNNSGYIASMFYVIIYALMSIGAFGMVIMLGRKSFEADNLDDFKGLADRSPWFAFIMLCLMFSMAGVPPFAGFWAKWYVLLELVNVDIVWLAAIAVFFSIIGAYYYLRVVRLMYFDKPDNLFAIKATRQMRMVITLNGMAVLFLGIFPGSLIEICNLALFQIGN